MKHTYIPKGVCSRQITVEVEDGIIKSVAFVGGCAGNTAGVSKLCVGRKVDDVIELLRGTQCRGGTSCLFVCPFGLGLAVLARTGEDKGGGEEVTNTAAPTWSTPTSPPFGGGVWRPGAST